jgi:hypothetical protein
MNDGQVELHRFIVETVVLDEFRMLCFDLGVRCDSLGSDPMGTQIRALASIIYAQRQSADWGSRREINAIPFIALTLSNTSNALNSSLPSVGSGPVRKACFSDGAIPAPNSRSIVLSASPGRSMQLWPGSHDQ